MAFTETQLEKIKSEMDCFIEKRRPPKHLRNKVDLAYKIDKLSIIIYEMRARFMGEGMAEMPVAKAGYVVKDDKWKIYWQRADLKWHLYEPKKEVKKLADFIKSVDEDKHRCFWG